MTKTYGATNPQQIIDLFEMRAKIADIGINRATTKAAKESYRAEAVAWREAADILRNTEFVGWSHDTRIVDPVKIPTVCDHSVSRAEGLMYCRSCGDFNHR